MTTKHLLAAALLLASLFALGFQSRPAQWEYKIEKDADERRLNLLGSEGWELVTLDRGSGAMSRSMFVFKRAR